MQKLNLKMTHSKEMLGYYFHLISTIVFLAGLSKIKMIILYYKN
jgi:hypothetical protein